MAWPQPCTPARLENAATTFLPPRSQRAGAHASQVLNLRTVQHWGKRGGSVSAGGCGRAGDPGRPHPNPGSLPGTIPGARPPLLHAAPGARSPPQPPRQTHSPSSPPSFPRPSREPPNPAISPGAPSPAPAASPGVPGHPPTPPSRESTHLSPEMPPPSRLPGCPQHQPPETPP